MTVLNKESVASRVVVSNGFSKFDMDYSAEEAARTGRLAHYLTGAYPTQFWRRLLSFRIWGGGIGRFLGRATRLPDSFIDSFAAAEFVHFCGQISPLALRGPNSVAEYCDVRSFQLYGAAASRRIERLRAPANIYHYRSGFGGRSLDVARSRGMVLLCEHSIAHPETLYYLIEHGGQIPDRSQVKPISGMWRLVLDDIAAADYVVTNSDFVKQTFTAMGFDTRKVAVLYRGIDDGFISLLRAAPARVPPVGPLRLLFAGAFSRRKGALCLTRAFQILKDRRGWTLTLAGPVEHDCRDAFEALAALPQVRVLGPLPRRELAAAMRQADVFVFPTLAEGSARVVSEALAAGCYVVTTQNCGSIVGAAAEGVLVEAENADALAATLAGLIDAPAEALAAGFRNAELVQTRYRQSHYGKNLIALYDRLASIRDTP